MTCFRRLRLWTALLFAPCAFAQGGHWGLQAEGAYGFFPDFILDRFSDQLSGFKVTQTNARSISAGLVRFKANGAPSFSIQYHQMDGDVAANRLTELASGTGSVRGVMASKHVNFFANEKVSGGLIVGGGVGKGELDYTTTINSASPVRRHEERTIPLIELLASVDIRPVKQLSIGPYYGFRNGFLMGGAAVRFHFR